MTGYTYRFPSDGNRGCCTNNNNLGYEPGSSEHVSQTVKGPLTERTYQTGCDIGGSLGLDGVPQGEEVGENGGCEDTEEEEDSEEEEEEDPPVTKAVIVELTLCVLSFIGRGLCLNSVGPTLLDLRQLTNATIEQSSLIFVSQSIGYLVGSISAKPLFERFNSRFLMATSLLLQAVATALLPTSRSLFLLCVAFVFQGFALAVVAIGVCSTCIRLGGRRKNGMYLQAAYVGVSIGSVLAPVIASPFLSEAATESSLAAASITGIILSSNVDASGSGEMDSSLNYGTLNTDSPLGPVKRGALTNISDETMNSYNAMDTSSDIIGTAAVAAINGTVSKGSSTVATVTTSVVSTASKVVMTTLEPVYSSETRILIDYIIMGLILCIPAVGFLILFFCKDGGTKSVLSLNTQKKPKTQGQASVPITYHTLTRPLTVVLVLLFINTMFYFGIQDAYSNLLTTFAVECQLHLSKATGVYMSSLFWLSVFIGRVAGIWIARIISPYRMMMLDLLGALIATAALVLFGQSSQAILWLGTFVLGISFASYNGCTVAWAAEHIDGKETILGLIMVGRCSGLLLVPTLTAVAFGALGAMSLMYALTLVCIILIVTLPFMQRLVRQHGGRQAKVGAKWPPSHHVDGGGDGLEKGENGEVNGWRAESNGGAKKVGEHTKLSAGGDGYQSDYGYDQ